MLCYIAHKFDNTESAANKAMADMNAIMEAEGFRNVGVHCHRPKGRIATAIAAMKSVATTFFKTGRRDTLVLQYPTSYLKETCRAAHMRRAKVVILIHDLESFRTDQITQAQETALLNCADFLIALNPAMEQWLRDHGSIRPSTSLGIWDYLSPEAREARVSAAKEPLHPQYELPKEKSGDYTVMFAGSVNRHRNQFLYDWGSVIRGYKVVVFGNNFDTTQAARPELFKLRGFVPSGLMIRHPEGDFGLVWDGHATAGCHGKWGEYLRFNNPHKASLYLRCGVPVIIWRNAGLAPFVESEGIGFTIGSLDEIATRLENLSADEYARMKENVARVSAQIASGTYLRAAIARALNYLSVEKNSRRQSHTATTQPTAAAAGQEILATAPSRVCS